MLPLGHQPRQIEHGHGEQRGELAEVHQGGEANQATRQTGASAGQGPGRQEHVAEPDGAIGKDPRPYMDRVGAQEGYVNFGQN